MTERSGCDEFASTAAELALGVLTGRERADALAHLERCDACRETVRQLTTTGEGLLGLLPPAEPPAGFETRVLARIGVPAQGAFPAPGAGLDPEAAVGHAFRRVSPSHARRKGHAGSARRLLAAAAVITAVVAAGAAGWGLRGTASPARTASPAGTAASPLRQALLLSASHENVGEVYYYSSGARWMYMSVDLDSGNGIVSCEIEGQDGHYTRVGSFRLDHGYASWGGATGGPAIGARVVSASGTVLATARFS